MKKRKILLLTGLSLGLVITGYVTIADSVLTISGNNNNLSNVHVGDVFSSQGSLINSNNTNSNNTSSCNKENLNTNLCGN